MITARRWASSCRNRGRHQIGMAGDISPECWATICRNRGRHDLGIRTSIRRAVMEHHVGIDVSLELSSLCVLDSAGKAIRETKVASEPEALVAFLRGLDLTIVRVGLEAGPLSQWLYDGCIRRGSRRCCSRRATSKPRCRLWQSRPIVVTPAGSPSCCGWVGIAPCTVSRFRRRKFGRFSPRASKCRARPWIWSKPCATCCAALGSRSAR